MTAILALALSTTTMGCNNQVENKVDHLQKERQEHREQIERARQQIERKKKELEQLKKNTPEDVKQAEQALREAIDDAEQEIAAASALLDQGGANPASSAHASNE